MRRQAIDWEKIMQKRTDKGLLLKFYNKNIKNLLKLGQKTQTDTSPKRIYRWQIQERSLKLFIIREMQIKAMRYSYTPVRTAKMKKTGDKGW